MNRNILIVLGGAVLVAFLVAMLVQISLGGKKKQPVIEEAKVEILVATRDLGIGRELQPADMRWQEWPKASVFPGAIVREKDESASDILKGRMGRNVASGEPLMKSALIGESKGNFVAASLEPGMRAIAIEVSASSMVGGFMEPGDYVDVILTYKENIKVKDDPVAQTLVDMNLDKYATETILQNVRVLAVDQMAKRAEEEKIKVGKTVTLAVSVKDAERLALAQEMGELMLALRGVGDNALVEKQWPTVSDARMSSMAEEIFTEYRKLKKDSGINPDIVRIYNGEQVQTISTK